MNRQKAARWVFGVLISVSGLAGLLTLPAQARPPINCRFVLCAAPDCLDTEHLQVPPGQCCPVCVPNK